MPPRIRSPAPSDMSGIRGPLVIMKCKITFNTPFGRLWRLKKKGAEIPAGAVRSFQHGGFWKKVTYERGRERPSFVSGLNQRLTEICPDGSKLFSMGNMWPPKWQGALRGVESHPLYSWGGALQSATKSAGCLLLFVLQMAPRRVRGQSDNHICKHTSPPEQHSGGPPAWPCCFWQVNVCNASTYRGECVSRALAQCSAYWVQPFKQRKAQAKIMVHSHRPTCARRHTHTHTHTSSLINSSSASWVCEASPP